MHPGAVVDDQRGELSQRLRWSTLVAAAGLILVGGLAYLPSFSGAFVFDDWAAIVGNTALDDWSQGWSALRRSSRWLGDLSFLLNVQLFGRTPWGFHAVNLAIHLATSLSLFVLLRWTMLRQPSAWSRSPWRIDDDAQAVWCDGLAFAIAALWVAHPLTTQAVTYIVQRYEQLAAWFTVLTLVCYVQGSASLRPWLWNCLAAGCVCLALGAKQTGIAAPILAAFYERVFFDESWATRLRRRGLFYVLSAPLVAFAVSGIVPPTQSSVPPGVAPASASASGSTPRLVQNEDFAGFDYADVSSWEYLRSQGNVLCHYVGLAVFPRQLCFDYGWPVAETPAEWLPGFVVVGAVFAIGLVLWCRGSPWGFLLLGPYVSLGPTSSVVPIRDLAVEHRVYLALAFWITSACLAAAWILARMIVDARQRWPWQRAIVAALLMAAVTRTWLRNDDYSIEARLWQRTTVCAPQNCRAFYNWGHALLRGGLASEAIMPLQRAIELSELPQNRRFITANELSQNHNRLGTARHQLGDVAAAIQEYDRAITLDPKSGLAVHNRANAHAIQGDVASAEADFQEAIKLLPHDAKVRFDYGNLCAQHRRHQEAIAQYSDALKRDPDLIDAIINRGTVLVESGRIEAGYRDLQTALRRLSPRDSRVANVQRWLQAIEAGLSDGGS